MSFKVDENNCANAGMKAYDGEERRSWQREADMLRSRLENIEGIAMDTKDLARATHDTVVAHADSAMAWKQVGGVWIQDPDSDRRRAARGRDLGQGPFQVVMP